MTRTGRLLVVSLIASAGCSPPGEHRVAVAGRVLFDGRPLSDATITFLPDPDKTGQGANAPIWNGRYSIPAEDGPSPGGFYILISDLRRDRPGSSRGKGRRLVPAEYGGMNELHVTIPADRKSWGFDFELGEGASGEGGTSSAGGDSSRPTPTPTPARAAD